MSRWLEAARAAREDEYAGLVSPLRTVRPLGDANCPNCPSKESEVRHSEKNNAQAPSSPKSRYEGIPDEWLDGVNRLMGMAPPPGVNASW